MMTHDPFQNFQTPGGYLGATSFGLPYTAFQPAFNPTGLAGQMQANPGIGGYGIYPNPLQGAGITGQLAPLQQLLAWNALAAGLQNPYLQHLQTLGPLQSPLAAAGLLNPQLGYHLGQQGWPQQQPQYGYPQIPQQTLTGLPGQGQPFGYPLAPQSFIGGGIGQPFGQIHPLAQQMALRQAGYGISPLAGCF
jgi:hypothetical protein